jgi:branched-chain amino acid transport system ATP-binding protein
VTAAPLPQPAVSPAALLRVTDLRLSYGTALALDGVSVEVRAGAAVAVLGANGAGKSSLARALAGLVRPSGGSIVFDGVDITRLPAHRRPRLGITYLPEVRGVFANLTTDDNLKMAVRYQGGRKQREESIDEVLELFPALGRRRRQLAGSLSGGEQQMLSLARGLAISPRLIIADELSLGLAPIVVDEVFRALDEARKRGVAVVLIEQFTDRALAMSDDAVVLRRGRCAWAGPAAAAQPELIRQYLGSGATEGSPAPTTKTLGGRSRKRDGGDQ